MQQARDEAAEAITAAWRASSQGALRAPDRDRQLVALVKAARERKIRRVNHGQGDALG